MGSEMCIRDRHCALGARPRFVSSSGGEGERARLQLVFVDGPLSTALVATGVPATSKLDLRNVAQRLQRRHLRSQAPHGLPVSRLFGGGAIAGTLDMGLLELARVERHVIRARVERALSPQDRPTACSLNEHQ